jgi:chloride channel protein, CIC family
VILVTLLLKTAASVVSLGTGFRGGLFFASLFLGGMIGRVYFFGVEYIDPSLVPDVNSVPSSGWQRLPLRSSARR